jgi:hypothetical protein
MNSEDFYIDNGYYVFTEKYHLKRGYCCKSGCRHCPWNFKNSLLSEDSKLTNPPKKLDENEN